MVGIVAQTRQRATPQTTSSTPSSAHACLRPCNGSPDLGCCLVHDQGQRRSRSLRVLAHRPSRRATILTLIFVKLEDDEIRAAILGMGRIVAISSGIRILVITTTNRHDLPRTVLLDPLLDQVNCVGKSADEVSRQQGQSLLHVSQEFRLRAGAEGGACGRRAATLRPRIRR
jgi:hypothetical protein